MAITDKGLALAVTEVRKALDTLPHGEAKKIIDSIELLINEADWLNFQRDQAREQIPAIETEASPRA